jgi:hypothetical protein
MRTKFKYLKKIADIVFYEMQIHNSQPISALVIESIIVFPSEVMKVALFSFVTKDI